MAEVGFSPATRVFEAAGAGACLITDAWEGIELFLAPDAEILVARDGQDVAEHLRASPPSAPAPSASGARPGPRRAHLRAARRRGGPAAQGDRSAKRERSSA